MRFYYIKITVTILVLFVLNLSILFAQTSKQKNSKNEDVDTFVERISQKVDLEQWKFFAENSQNNLMFYNTKRIVRDKQDVSVWVKNYYFRNENVFPQNKEINEILKENDISYDLFRFTMNCGKEKYITSYRSFHKQNGEQIGSALDNLNVTSDVVPDTTTAILYDELCKQKESKK